MCSYYTWATKKEPDDRYIIIGNGFDIACGLKTRYSEFLDGVKAAKDADDWRRKEGVEKFGGAWDNGEQIEAYLEFTNTSWYRLFDAAEKRAGWIDFEREISELVTLIEKNMGTDTRMSETIIIERESTLFKRLKKMLPAEYPFNGAWNTFGPRRVEFQTEYDKLYQRLREDFEKIKKALWHYLDYQSKYKIPEEQKHITWLLGKIGDCCNAFVISFNYTPTLERILERRGITFSKDNFCYIHGQLNHSADETSMVLGMGGNHHDEGARFNHFRKSYQRSANHTSLEYRNWIERLKESGQRFHELIVFGHSLSETDQDVIKPFLNAKNMRIKIYCYNDVSKEEMHHQLASYMNPSWHDDLSNKGILKFDNDLD